jgi:hypothetical protein
LSVIDRDHLDWITQEVSLTDKNHLWPEEIIYEKDQLTLAATLERPDGTRRRLWYRIPAAYREALTESCDPFVLGLLFTVMKSTLDFHVHGEVSPSLLCNLAELQLAWACWKPAKYHRIEISADLEREQPRVKSDQVIIGFSSGADSAYSAWRHCTGRAGRQQRNLSAGVMLHGFDIPLKEEQVFAQAVENTRSMLASIGMELIPIATNFREVGGTWEDAFASGLASGLALLQGRYNTGLIASGYDYSCLVFPWGSNPVTDGLMSSGSFQLIHDGAALSKMKKIEQISVWPEAMKHLRVCFDGRSACNCCRCAKCMKTILLFRILRLDLPECFERDITDSDLLRMRWKSGEIENLGIVVAQARAASISASWVWALQFSLLINRLRLRLMQGAPFRKGLRSLYRYFFPPLE